jgi:hypothetical protein
MQSRFEEIVTRLLDAHHEGLVSIILSGPAVEAPGNAHAADYHLFIVTESLSLQDLKRASSALRWWESLGYSRPTCFTKKEFLASLDVFPVEFGEIKRGYRVLFGADLLEGVEISKANLRLLVEYELRGKFLRLRNLYLPSSDDSHRLSRLMMDSVATFAQYLRIVPELFGEEPPLSRVATVRRAGELLKVDSASLVRVLRMREAGTHLYGIEIQDIFESYLRCLEEMIDAIDRI